MHCPIAALTASLALSGPALASDLALPQVLHYPFVAETAAAPSGDHIAWIRELGGARNVWLANGPNFLPRNLTQASADDGQELSQLTFSQDGRTLLYARGGDHDQNWPAQGDLQPNPANALDQPQIAIWLADLTTNAPPRKLVEGDHPVISSRGTIAFVRNHEVWVVNHNGTKAHRLFFDRGHDGALAFSPDGQKLAFVSDRGDHAFIGIYAGQDKPIEFLAASTSTDETPIWSPDSTRIAFVREPAQPPTTSIWLPAALRPWSIMVADAATGTAHTAWKAPETHRGAIVFTSDALHFWAANGKVVFLATLDGWQHLYAVPAAGGAPTLLTPGAFMVEQMQLAPDRASIVYTANTGGTANDSERRHLFRVTLADARITEVTSGEGIESNPALGAHEVAFVQSDARTPPRMEVLRAGGTAPAALAGQGAPADFPAGALLAPKPVTFKSPDGMLLHADLFQPPNPPKPLPAVVFVHGGPVRQMLLGWHYMDYYANAYAVNQYLAAHGFTVLALNYRLGIGYGQDFLEPMHAGPQGAAEYQDVQAAARFLSALPQVDSGRIGIWGGSYGGFLTATALARDSGMFRAGVDLHGVHDWRSELDGAASQRLQARDPIAWKAMNQLAYESSPIAAIATWHSPILLIQGDDDRNVHFSQTVDLAALLRTRPVHVEELILPNEVHDFRRHESWVRADTATVEFLERELATNF